VSTPERAVSIAAGSILALLGAGRRDLMGLLIAGVGGGMIYRGATGYCPAYGAAGIDTSSSTPEELAERGTRVAQSYLIDKPAEELYRFWRNFENLPTFMSYLQSVKVVDDRKSHWVTKAPAIAGGQVEWDAEITADEPNKRISWRSLPGSSVENAGTIEFEKALGDRGTLVKVEMNYVTPAGSVGKWVAKLLGESPERQIKEDLRNFKRLMETGEVPTVEGQPKGQCMKGTGKREGE
jgi:uncharacterized membrane protein